MVKAPCCSHRPGVLTSSASIPIITGGFVFPGAVDKGIVAAIRLNGTDRVRAYALDLGESSEFGLREEDKPAESWARYIFGVCREVQKRGGKIGGFDTVLPETCLWVPACRHRQRSNRPMPLH